MFCPQTPYRLDSRNSSTVMVYPPPTNFTAVLCRYGSVDTPILYPHVFLYEDGRKRTHILFRMSSTISRTDLESLSLNF